MYRRNCLGRGVKKETKTGAEAGSAEVPGYVNGGFMRSSSSYAREDRDLKKVPPTSRRRCGCGCGQRATHTGTGQGAAMVTGCELAIRRWVRDGLKIANKIGCVECGAIQNAHLCNTCTDVD